MTAAMTYKRSDNKVEIPLPHISSALASFVTGASWMECPNAPGMLVLLRLPPLAISLAICAVLQMIGHVLSEI
jgi:hypothetical protein